MKIFVSLLAVVLWSCSESNDDFIKRSNHYIKFKVDGKQITYSGEDDYSSNLFSIFNQKNDSEYISVASGIKNNSDSENNHISLSISNQTEIQVNTIYTNNAALANSKEPLLFLVIYIDSIGVHYSTVNNALVIPENGVLDGQILYTEVNNDIVKGKFSGTIYNENDEGVQITEGEFFIPRIIANK